MRKEIVDSLSDLNRSYTNAKLDDAKERLQKKARELYADKAGVSDSDSLSSADKADADALLAAATGIAPSQSSTNGGSSTVAAPSYYVMPAPAPVVAAPAYYVMPAPAPVVPVYAKPVHPWAYQHPWLYNLIK